VPPPGDECDGRFDADLNSPVVGETDDTFDWTIERCPGAQGNGWFRNVKSITISGCWHRGDIDSVEVSDGKVKVGHDGTIKVFQLRNDDLPLDVTVKFDDEFLAGEDTVEVFVKETGWPGWFWHFLFTFFQHGHLNADGPVCEN